MKPSFGTPLSNLKFELQRYAYQYVQHRQRGETLSPDVERRLEDNLRATNDIIRALDSNGGTKTAPSDNEAMTAIANSLTPISESLEEIRKQQDVKPDASVNSLPLFKQRWPGETDSYLASVYDPAFFVGKDSKGIMYHLGPGCKILEEQRVSTTGKNKLPLGAISQEDIEVLGSKLPRAQKLKCCPDCKPPSFGDLKHNADIRTKYTYVPKKSSIVPPELVSASK